METQGKSKKSAKTFGEAYAKLNEIAGKLRDARTPMVDELLPLVEEAAKAKRVCDERIEAVRKLVEERMGEKNVQTF